MQMDLVVVVIQAAATVGTLMAAVAALRAVKFASVSARFSREAIVLPAKQEHTTQIKELLGVIEGQPPLGGTDLIPDKPPPVKLSNQLPAVPNAFLFDDLDNHFRGFQGKWDHLVILRGRYINTWNDVTKRLNGEVEKYRSFLFFVETVPRLHPNLMLGVWKQFEINPQPTATVFEFERIERRSDAFILDVRILGQGVQRVADLCTESAAKDVWEKLQNFRAEFQQYDEFSGLIHSLHQQYEQLQLIRNDLTQSIQNTYATVVFPEECRLLGVK